MLFVDDKYNQMLWYFDPIKQTLTETLKTTLVTKSSTHYYASPLDTQKLQTECQNGKER